MTLLMRVTGIGMSHGYILGDGRREWDVRVLAPHTLVPMARLPSASWALPGATPCWGARSSPADVHACACVCVCGAALAASMAPGGHDGGGSSREAPASWRPCAALARRRRRFLMLLGWSPHRRKSEARVLAHRRGFDVRCKVWRLTGGLGSALEWRACPLHRCRKSGHPTLGFP